MIEAMIRDSGRMTKRGKDVIRGLQVVQDRVMLNYTGPRDIEGLFKANFYDRRSVGNQTSRVMRTRPMFRNWSAKFEVLYDAEIFNGEDVVSILKTGGAYIGLGDYRPRFGKFSVKALH